MPAVAAHVVLPHSLNHNRVACEFGWSGWLNLKGTTIRVCSTIVTWGVYVAGFFVLVEALAPPVHAAARSSATPAFCVDVPNPTADKPQSKLWYAQGFWWACLPAREGNQIWKRSDAGWVRSDGAESPLYGIHGHGDVYAERDRVYIVLVSSQALTVVVLRYDGRQGSYVRAGCPTVWLVAASQKLETATITKDRTGRCWVAYNAGNSVWVRASRDVGATRWTVPIQIGCGTHPDDICTITRLQCGVGVIWSNQNTDSIRFRIHCDRCSPYNWNREETVAQGGKTADDHLHAAVTEDGTLYVATKTSLDELGKPIFSLRERSPNGHWRSRDYATLRADAKPSRPIALLSQYPPSLVLCHTVRGPGGLSSIATLVYPRPCPELLDAAIEIIEPTQGLDNVTGCKSFLPPNAPAIVLASDRQGRVYEATIPLVDRREAPPVDRAAAPPCAGQITTEDAATSPSPPRLSVQCNRRVHWCESAACLPPRPAWPCPCRLRRAGCCARSRTLCRL